MKKVLFGAALFCAVMLVACGGDKAGKVRMGSLSGDVDSLSYSLGSNIGYGMKSEMKDIPFNYDRLAKGIEEGAFGKSKMEHDEALRLLQDYFMTKRGPRAMEVAEQRAAADSVRMAAGDSTKMEYPADPSMFLSEGERDSLSYAFGIDIGNNMVSSDLPLQIVWVNEAMKDVREDTPKMSEDDVNAFIQHYFMVTLPTENAEASAKWLEGIAKKSGVKKTESGLLYKVVKEGDMNTAAKDDRDLVMVYYKGMNRDGKVFDATRFADKPAQIQKILKENNPEGFDKDEPAQFQLNQVIKGWTEGIKLVGKGGRILLWIPSDLAYGERGHGRAIGPNEALYFEVDVDDVVPYEEQPAASADSLQTEAPATPEAVK